MNFLNFTSKKGRIITFALLFIAFITVPRATHALATTDVLLVFVITAGPFFFEWFFWILTDKIAVPLINLSITHLIGPSALTVTRDIFVLNLWNIAKDWANMVIVVALIGIALATILNLEKYKAQKLLFPLILVALLVNFTPVLVGLPIDLSNIIMRDFLSTASGGPRLIVDQVVEIERSFVQVPFWNLVSGGRIAEYPRLFESIINIVIRIFTMTSIYLVLFVAFIYLAFILIVRYAMLTFLFIVSPLAFVFMIFPIDVCRKIWQGWLDHFIRWCFIGVGTGFTLRLSMDMFSALSGFSMSASDVDSAGPMTFRLYLTGLVLFIGLFVTTKSARKIATAVMGIAKTAGLAIATGGAGLVGKLAMSAGGARAWNATKTAASATAVKFGLRSGAKHEQMKQGMYQPTKEEQNEVNNMSPEELKGYAEGKATSFGMPTGKAQRMKAAAITRSFGLGLMKDKSTQQQEDLANYAIGADKNNAGTIIKANAGLAHLDTDKMGELKAKNPIKKGESPDEHEDRIKKMAHSEAYRRLDSSDVDKMSKSDLTALAQDTEDTSGQAAKARERMIKEDWQSDIEKNPEKLAKILDKDKKDFNSNGFGSAIKQDHRLAGHDEEGAILELKKDEVREANPTITDEAEIERRARARTNVTTDDHREQATQSAAEKIGAEKAVTDLSSDARRDWARRNGKKAIQQALRSRNISSRVSREILEGAMSDTDEKSRKEKIGEFSGKDIAKSLKAEPKYTKEEMDEAEAKHVAAGNTKPPASSPVARSAWDNEIKNLVKEKHEVKMGEIVDSLDEKALAEAMEEADANLKKAMAKAIVKNVADDVSAMTPEKFAEKLPEITKKLGAIPNTEIADAMSSLDPTLKKNLKGKFMRGGAAPETERPATPEEIKKAKDDRDNDIKSLRSKNYLMSDEDIEKENVKIKASGGTPPSFEQSYDSAVKARNKDAMAKMKPIEIPSEDDASTNDIELAKKKREEDIEKLRKSGHMLSAERMRIIIEVAGRTATSKGVDPSFAIEQVIKDEYNNATTRRNKDTEAKMQPIKIPVPGTTVPLKLEEQKKAEQYFEKPEVEQHWQNLDDEDRKKLEELLRSL